MAIYEPLATRFWRKITKSDACWEWLGKKTPTGYGQISGVNRKMIYVHRYSWELHNGHIPKGMMVCHKCDNRGCANPSHMFLGTCKDNKLDSMSKDRHVYGSRSGKSKLTESIVEEIRKCKGIVPSRNMSQKFDVSMSTIQRVINGSTWRHVNV